MYRDQWDPDTIYKIQAAAYKDVAKHHPFRLVRICTAVNLSSYINRPGVYTLPQEFPSEIRSKDCWCIAKYWFLLSCFRNSQQPEKQAKPLGRSSRIKGTPCVWLFCPFVQVSND